MLEEVVKAAGEHKVLAMVADSGRLFERGLKDRARVHSG